MIRLVSRGVAQGQFRDERLGRITTAAVDPDLRADHAFLVRPASATPDLTGYAGVLVLPGAEVPTTDLSATKVGEELSYLSDGDVVLMTPSGWYRV